MGEYAEEHINPEEIAGKVKLRAGRRGKRRKEQDVKKSGRYGRNAMREEEEKHSVR